MKNKKALVCDICGKKYRLEFWFRKHVAAHQKECKANYVLPTVSSISSAAIDPLEVLPPELVLRIFSLLDAEDLVHLWEVNRRWRKLVKDPAVWRSAEMNLGLGVHSECLKVLLRAPCLGRIVFNIEAILTDKMKATLLKTKTKIYRVNGVLFYSNSDYGWAIRFLKYHGPHLEELSMCYFNEELLNTATTLPSLRRLHIEMDLSSTCDEALSEVALKVPVGFTGGLKCFTIEDNRTLPYDFLVSLLSAHSRTLQEVYMCVGTQVDPEFKWPISCDIVDMLLKCQFKALKHLILVRPSDLYHSLYPESCHMQMAAVSLLLPDVVVTCTICNGEEGKLFKEKNLKMYI
ncbi:F-box/LRR-repeat protein 7-like [Thrips palmi]|uniref:F-box/LRR-repeat protein 7-like n=1 Tax=Thrips palmi TaxID=161013 RepID=A0A6P8YR18_THRPL|nr:F-box/LRR-repeat protein 7-like [Thrips palmi]